MQKRVKVRWWLLEDPVVEVIGGYICNWKNSRGICREGRVDEMSERGRLVWELPDIERPAVWWTEENAAKRELEAVQERMDRRLLRTSITVARAAVRGDLGWRKLERREEKKLLFRKRLDNLEDSRLVKHRCWMVKGVVGVDTEEIWANKSGFVE